MQSADAASELARHFHLPGEHLLPRGVWKCVGSAEVAAGEKL